MGNKVVFIEETTSSAFEKKLENKLDDGYTIVSCGSEWVSSRDTNTIAVRYWAVIQK